MQYSYTIEYNPNVDPYKPKIEQFEATGNSIFQNIYEQALTQIDLILRSGKETKDNIREEFDYQNIVAFTGERGTGKTSAMMSIATTLKNSRALPNQFHCKNEKFFVLSPINPAHISENETVLDTILASLYTQFEDAMKISDMAYNSSLEEKQSLYRSFEKLHGIIQKQCYNRERIYKETELFQNTAASATLKYHLHDLLKNYLKIMQCDNLILQIDDIDLNLDHAYLICEDLRKYLSIPNVVVLFAINLNQLYALMEQHYYNALDSLYQHGNADFIRERVPQMAEQYLRKLIPTSRRCVLPELKLTSQKYIKLLIKEQGIQGAHSDSLIKILLNMIHAKTGVILVAKNDEHPLIPDNLRGLWHLLTLLKSMVDIPLVKENGVPIYYPQNSRLSRQLDLLEQYFRDEIVPKLRIDERDLFDCFNKIPNAILNKYIIRKVCNLIQKETAQSILDCPEIENIKNLSNIPEAGNVSCGDVLYVLNIYEKTLPERVLFPALVRLFYSIRSIRTRFLDKNHGNTELFYLLGGSIVSLAYNKIIANDILCTISMFKEDFITATDELSSIELTDDECSEIGICLNAKISIQKMALTIYNELVNREYPASLFTLGKINEVYLSGRPRSLRSSLSNDTMSAKKGLSTQSSFEEYFKRQDELYYDTRLSPDCSLGNNTFLYFSAALPVALVYRLLDSNDITDIIPLCSMDVLQYFSSQIRSITDKKDKYRITEFDRVDAFEKAVRSIMDDCQRYSYLESTAINVYFDYKWEKEKTFMRLLHIAKLIPSIIKNREEKIHLQTNNELDSVSDKIFAKESREACRKAVQNTRIRYLRTIKKIQDFYSSYGSVSEDDFVKNGKNIMSSLKKMQGIRVTEDITPDHAALLQNESNAFRNNIIRLCKDSTNISSAEPLMSYMHHMEDILRDTIHRLDDLSRRL